jgi:hypothetical protein
VYLQFPSLFADGASFHNVQRPCGSLLPKQNLMKKTRDDRL